MASWIASSPQRRSVLSDLTDKEAAELEKEWLFWAREAQIEPEGQWPFWLVCAGRGFGKTRTGAEWIRARIENKISGRVAFVAPTASDARDVMVEGESGILAISPNHFRPLYEPSKRRLTWPNGAIATLYSAEEPDRLRGPQHDAGWLDEIAAWERPETLDMFLFGLRLGIDPRWIGTTTPKPTKIIRDLMADPEAVFTRGSTYDNRGNLAAPFLKNVLKYEGTRLGRQEIHAELIDLSEDAIFKRGWWKVWNKTELPKFAKIVLSFDTASKTGVGNNYSAVTVWGTWEIEGVLHAMLIGAWRDKLIYPDLKRKVLDLIELWSERRKDDYGALIPPEYVLIEDTSAGTQLIQEFDMAGMENIVALSVDGKSKLARADIVSDILSSGLIHVPGKKLDDYRRSETVLPEWAEMVVGQMEAFRGVEKDEDDDVVDTCTQCWSFLRKIGLDLPSDAEIEDEEIDDAPTVGAIYG